MKIGIHQPEHLPWLGFFDRLKNVDKFIILDHVDYKKNNYQNRAKINKSSIGTQWLTVPIKHANSENRNIFAIEIQSKWERKYLEKIRHFYSKTKYFNEIYPEIQNIVQKNPKSLSQLNIDLIRYLANYLEITTPMYLSSDYNFEKKKSDLIIEICKKFGAESYISGVGGKQYLDYNNFKKENIKIYVRDYQCTRLNGQKLIKGISTLDIIMREGKESVKALSNNNVFETTIEQ